MAEKWQPQCGVELEPNQFYCSVCLDLLKDPVTIQCGHTYCRSCIEGCWEQEKEKGTYSCPQCREAFSPRPVLGRNNMLAEILKSLSISCESPDLPRGAVVRPKRSMKTVTDYVSDLTYDMQNLLETTWPKISATVSVTDVVLPPVPKTRGELLHYHCPLTVDPNSVNKCFVISRQSKRVTSGCYEHFRLSHSDRFGGVKQVLCREGLTGRCYWEVSWSGGAWSVAASYKNISRTSFDSEFGKNDKSWCLECSAKGYTFRHNSVAKAVSGPRTS